MGLANGMLLLMILWNWKIEIALFLQWFYSGPPHRTAAILCKWKLNRMTHQSKGKVSSVFSRKDVDGMGTTWLKRLLICWGLKLLNGLDPWLWFTKGQRPVFELRAHFSWPKCFVVLDDGQGSGKSVVKQTDHCGLSVSTLKNLKPSSLLCRQKASVPSNKKYQAGFSLPCCHPSRHHCSAWLLHLFSKFSFLVRASPLPSPTSYLLDYNQSQKYTKNTTGGFHSMLKTVVSPSIFPEVMS